MNRSTSLENLCTTLGYQFQKMELLRQAMTHKSYILQPSGQSVENNERLEFLGDAVLDLIISEMLMERFPSLSEGGLSKSRASLVNENRLRKIAHKLELGDYLLMGKGEEMTGGRTKSSLLADAVEALIAAIYLDSRTNSGMVVITQIVHQLFQEHLPEHIEDFTFRDFKSELQEYVQKKIGILVTYQLISHSGPDHQKEFEMAALIENQEQGRGSGSSKKQATQMAAKQALKNLQSISD